MTDPTEFVEWLKKVFEAGSAVIIGLALVGSYFGIWMWRKEHERFLQVKDQRIAELTAERDELKQMLYGLVPTLQATVTNTLTKGRR